MAYYKITDTELNRITRLLDKIVKEKLDKFEDFQISAKILSQEIKNNYTKIK